MEEFEEKIDRIADGEDSSNDSWISKIYNQFSFFNDEDNSLAEEDMDGLEPPILDETWGLGVRSKGKETWKIRFRCKGKETLGLGVENKGKENWCDNFPYYQRRTFFLV